MTQGTDMPSETHVTGTAMRVTVECEGATYTIRPITFGEAAALATAEAGDIGPNQAMLNDALREALRAMGPDAAPHLDVIDQHEDAEIELHSINAAQPHPQEPATAFSEWREARRRQHAAVMRLLVRKAKAEALVAADPRVREIRAALENGAWTRRTKLIELAADMTPDQVGALPAGHAEAIFLRADAMRRPGSVEGKA